MSMKMLQARENLMEAIQAFLKKYDQMPPKEKIMALLLAEKRFLKIKQALEEEHNQPKNIQELLLKLINDLKILNGIQLKQEEQAAKVSSQYWKPPIFDNDDDEEKDEHLNTIPDTESDEENESSVKDLNLTPSESEDLSDNEKSLLNRDTSMVSSPKIDSLLKEFSGELTHINLIPPRINEANFDPEENIHHDSDYLMEEIDIFLAPDDSIPSGIENDDYDSEGDNLFLEELLTNDSLPENESFHFDRYYISSSPLPPEKPLDDDGIYFDIEPDMGVLTAKVFNPGFPRF
nr:hypothetical protein [Tanacetum cinerariifolium]